MSDRLTNIEIAVRMRKMGWPVGPALPGMKKTYYKWLGMTPSTPFNTLFYRQPLDCNVFILMDKVSCCVDLDAHGAEPNGRTLFDNLDPEVYKGCIVEESQSKGVHLYYAGMPWEKLQSSWVPGFDYCSNVIIDKNGMSQIDRHRDGSEKWTYYMSENIVSRAGHCITYSYPSMTPKGTYHYLSERTHLNTRPDELPPLHWIWQLCPPYEGLEYREEYNGPKNTSNEPLTPKQLQYQIDAIMNTRYKVKSGFRHREGICAAGEFLSLGLGYSEVVRLTEQYLENIIRNRLLEPGEVEGNVKYAMNKGIHEPFIRRQYIRDQEKKDAKKTIMKMVRGG